MDTKYLDIDPHPAVALLVLSVELGDGVAGVLVETKTEDTRTETKVGGGNEREHRCVGWEMMIHERLPTQQA